MRGGPWGKDRLVMLGPGLAPTGTGATMLVDVQVVGIEVAPLNVTRPTKGFEPKFVPLMVTDVPTGPEVGDRGGVMLGVGSTGNGTALLETWLTVTTRF